MENKNDPELTMGKQGENIAAAFLEKKGWLIFERNYRFQQAEVDIVCFEPAPRYEDGGEIVFVEVKTRGGKGFGRPEDAVTLAKQKHITRAAEAFLHERRLDGAVCRFDVVAVMMNYGAEPSIEHFRHAFVGV